MTANDIWLIAGLGNPEAKYEGTRHNTGFAALDYLAGKWGIPVSKAKFQGLWGQGEVDGRKGVAPQEVPDEYAVCYGADRPDEPGDHPRDGAFQEQAPNGHPAVDLVLGLHVRSLSSSSENILSALQTAALSDSESSPSRRSRARS